MSVFGEVLSFLSLLKDVPGWWLNQRHKKTLKAMLAEPKYEFGRTIETLQRSIGANQELTEKLLREIGARQSLADPELWTLQKPS